MGKYSFNVCCDSSNNFYSQINGSTTSYFFDWSLIKDCQYNVTFSYMSDDTTTTLSPVMTIWSDLTGSPNTYLANGGATYKIGLLGNLRPNAHGANTFYYAETKTNPPIQMYKPTNNVFTIFLRNALTNVAYSTPVAAQYVLILHFEEVDE